MTTWAERKDELERTTFAGQIDLDGHVLEQDVVVVRTKPERCDADKPTGPVEQETLFSD